MHTANPIQIPSPLQELRIPEATRQDVRVMMKRDDLIHPLIGGNKWRKLKHNLEAAKSQNKSALLTFGGAWSNHIHATAAAGRLYGISTIGVIRGEEPARLSSTLSFAIDQGMKLFFTGREQYRHKYDPGFIQSLRQKFGDFYVVPEGGNNTEGVKGCEEIVKEIDMHFDHFCLPCGTGTTLAGVANVGGNAAVTGFSALKDGSFLHGDISPFLTNTAARINIESAYSFGGYAKATDELQKFIIDFHEQHKIILDPVYTGKMMYGVTDLLRKGYFSPGSTVIVLHTGGLQGIAGFPDLHRALFTKA